MGITNHSEVQAVPRTRTSQSLVSRSAASSTSWLTWKRSLEAVVLSCILLVVWGLFSVPTILYALSSPQQVN